MAIVGDAAFNEGALDHSLDNDRYAIVPSDTLPLKTPIDAIIVTGAGTVRFGNPDGSTIDIEYEIGGPYFIGQPVKVYSTGTDATGLIGVVSKALR